MQANNLDEEKIYTRQKLENVLKKSNKTIQDVEYFEILNDNVTSIEDNLFCGGIYLQSLNLIENKIQIIHMGMFKCKHIPNKCLSLLNKLDLSHNSISRILPNGFTGLGASLRKLFLSSNKISIIEPTTFESMNQLEELNLSDNEFETIKVEYFKELSKLKILDLSFNKIKKIEKDSLKELKRLEEVMLQHNLLVELDTQLFRGLNKLEIIYLYYNKLNNNLDNKLPLYLEINVQHVALYADELWADNNLNFIHNLVYKSFL